MSKKHTQAAMSEAARWAADLGIPIGDSDDHGVAYNYTEFGPMWLRTEGPVSEVGALLLRRNPPLGITRRESMPHLQFLDAFCELTGLSVPDAVDLVTTSVTDRNGQT